MRPGDTIGPHRLVRTIGSGAFATVWLAVDQLLDADVAIKVLADNWARDADVRRRFVEEARILRRIDHDRIVRVFSVDDPPDEQPMFVMSYADRGSLGDLLRAQRDDGTHLGEAAAAAVLLELLAALRVVHDYGVIHRDLKPSNVLFRSYRRYEQQPESDHPLAALPGAMVLADFGLAKDTIARSGFTAAAGTPAYMAPEQSRTTSELDERADVYAATAILFELLTGRAPSARSTLDDVRGAEDRPPRLDESAPIDPMRLPAWQAIIDRGLAHEPAVRFGSAAELIDAITAVGVHDGPPVVERTSLVSGEATPSLTPIRQRVADLLERFDAEHSTAIDRRQLEPPRVAIVGDVAARGEIHDLLADRPIDVIDVATGDIRVETADVVVAADDAAVEIDGRFGPVWIASAPVDLDRLVVVVDLLLDQADLVVASAALDRLDDDVRLAGSVAMSQAWMEIADDVEQLRLDVPQLADPAAARIIVAGRAALTPTRRDEAIRVLLGEDLGGRAEIERRLADWRAFQSSGDVAFTARSATATVVRALERRWLVAS